jgi:hypothetical protein
MNLVNIKKFFGAGLLILIASLGKLANNSKKAAKSTKSYLRSEKALHSPNYNQILALKNGLHKHGESQDSKNNNQNSKYGRACKNNLNLKTKNK